MVQFRSPNINTEKVGLKSPSLQLRIHWFIGDKVSTDQAGNICRYCGKRENPSFWKTSYYLLANPPTKLISPVTGVAVGIEPTVTGVKQAGRWVGMDACRIRYKCYN
jgi:hypothetical protein